MKDKEWFAPYNAICKNTNLKGSLSSVLATSLLFDLNGFSSFKVVHTARQELVYNWSLIHIRNL
jgi:hypothetical protein